MIPPRTVPLNDLNRIHRGVAAELREAVSQVIQSGSFILGEQVSRFEAAFAEFSGAADCVSMANGTDAIELALRALEVQPGDEVITVANAGGYATCAIRALQATPVYVDITETDLLLDPAQMELCITPRTRAVIATHLYGKMADMPRIVECAKRKGLVVVEDCSQAHGASIDNRMAGTWSAIGCFSFYPTKNLGALGDAGGAITSDPRIALNLRKVRQYGWEQKFRASTLTGRNSRLDEMQAALLLVKLKHLAAWNAERRAIAAEYRSAFADLPIGLPMGSGESHVFHLFVIQTGQRDELRTHLQNAGVHTEVHYPIPDYRQLNSRAAANGLPITERAVGRILSLPCFPGMTEAEVAQVIDAVRGFCWRGE